MVIGSSIWEEAREFWVGKQKQKIKRKRKRKTPIPAEEKSKEEYIGPDTSSLTAFLLSLLSLSEPSGSYNENGNAEEEGEDGSSDGEEEEDGGGEGTAASSSSEVQGPQSRGEGELEKSFGFEPPGRAIKGGSKGEDSPGTSAGGDDTDADWQLVSEKDLAISKHLDHHHGAKAAKPLKLPAMSEESSLLPENLRSVIYDALPTLAQGRQWVLLYSTLKHGISLRTLYRKSGLLAGPCLLVAGDRLGAIFGGLVPTPLKPTSKMKYQGTNECFVFTNVTGTPRVFRSTGSNRYFILCTSEAIAFGGGGHFALHLDSELLYGTSAACETYGNPGLATTEEFVLKNVELWGFAHTSRYVPRYASFKEPEIVPGIYSW